MKICKKHQTFEKIGLKSWMKTQDCKTQYRLFLNEALKVVTWWPTCCGWTPTFLGSKCMMVSIVVCSA